jgi:hypothetical protein
VPFVRIASLGWPGAFPHVRVTSNGTHSEAASQIESALPAAATPVNAAETKDRMLRALTSVGAMIGKNVVKENGRTVWIIVWRGLGEMARWKKEEDGLTYLGGNSPGLGRDYQPREAVSMPIRLELQEACRLSSRKSLGIAFRGCEWCLRWRIRRWNMRGNMAGD